MSIYKRNKIWWIQLTDPSGKRIQISSGTEIESEAQAIHDALKLQFSHEKILNIKPAKTWIDAGDDWAVFNNEKKSLKTDAHHFRLLKPCVGDLLLSEITEEVVQKFVYDRITRDRVKNNTVNRSLALLKAVLYRALDNKWIDVLPNITLLNTDDARDRYLKPEQAIQLLKHLPERLRALVQFTLATGLRESNLLNLTWDDIDFNKGTLRIERQLTKSKATLYFPLNSTALKILYDQQGMHDVLVFPSAKGKVIKKAGGKAWRTALKKAGIRNFRWHDLRHTWASWHIQNGTSLYELQKLGGWKTMQCVMRYAHLANNQLKSTAENVCIPLLSAANDAEAGSATRFRLKIQSA